MATSPDPTFQKLIKEMRNHSRDIGAAIDNDAQRAWMLPPLADWDGNLFDIAGMAAAFNRDTPNADYEQAVLQDGRMSDCMGAKVQIDYTALMERAFRARHMTPTRALAHAAGRRKGHGEAQGAHSGVVIQYVQDLLRSGLK